MNQRRTIMGACEYSIAYLKGLQKGLLDHGSPNQQLQWAIGGIIITLCSNLLHNCDDKLRLSLETEKDTSREALIKIKQEFNEFIDNMLNQQS